MLEGHQSSLGSQLDPYDPTVFCKYCDRGNHPQWMCNYRNYHGKQILTWNDCKKKGLPYNHHKMDWPGRKQRKQEDWSATGWDEYSKNKHSVGYSQNKPNDEQQWSDVANEFSRSHANDDLAASVATYEFTRVLSSQSCSAA